ncbi:MAG: PAS domain S-box protein, partial [Desertifilum sp. SIO1I2]|nr:PAS domain S-box protein [Desertifilum sp. SIO1I2]
MQVPRPPDEEARLAALYQYGILDTPPEEDFDALTQLAAQICQAPIALISLMDCDRQWFKSKIGIDGSGTSREVAFCAYAILQTDILVVPDALEDERFANNPYVTSAPYIRFYAGVPLVTPSGAVVGTLCVIDRVARSLEPQQLSALKALGKQAVSQLELRRRIVELDRTTQKKQQAQAELESFFNLSLDLLCVVNFAGEFKRINPAFATVLGYSPAEMIAQTVRDLVHPDDRDRTAQALEQLSQGELIVNFENRYRTKTGEYLWLAWKARPLVEQNLIYAIARDITERKLLENQHLQRLADETAARIQIANILESITDAFFALDRQWCFTYVNRQAERLLQHQRDELIGKNIWEEFPEAVKIDFYTQYHRALTEQISITFTEFYPPLDCWFLVRVYPSSEGLSVYFQDITASKQAEVALRQSEERYRLLFESNPHPMWVNDVETLQFLAINQAAIQHYGYSRAEFLSMSIKDIRPPEEI